MWINTLNDYFNWYKSSQTDQWKRIIHKKDPYIHCYQFYIVITNYYKFIRHQQHKCVNSQACRPELWGPWVFSVLSLKRPKPRDQQEAQEETHLCSFRCWQNSCPGGCRTKVLFPCCQLRAGVLGLNKLPTFLRSWPFPSIFKAFVVSGLPLMLRSPLPVFLGHLCN